MISLLTTTPATERPDTWGGLHIRFADGSDHDTLRAVCTLGDAWVVHTLGADFRVLGYEEDDNDLFLRLAPADPETGDVLDGYQVLRLRINGPVSPTITVY